MAIFERQPLNHLHMYKNYILPVICFVLTLGMMVFTYFYDAKGKTGDKVEYKLVFNSATVESKIVGKSHKEITAQYLPEKEILKKGRKGTFTASYDGLRIFTQGDRREIRSMEVDFKDSVAVALRLGEPREKTTWSAKVLNLNPLMFKLIDAEFATRTITASNGKAKGWQVPLLLVLALVFVVLGGVGGFNLVWPLLTFLCRKLGFWVATVMGLFIILAASWLWWPLLAYTSTNIGSFLVIGVPFTLYAIIKLFAREPEEPEEEWAPAPVAAPKNDYSDDSNESDLPDWGHYLEEIPHVIAINHLKNLWYLVCMGNFENERCDLHAEYADEMPSISGEEYRTTLIEDNSYEPYVMVPASQSLRQRFVEDYCCMLVCHTPVKFSLVNIAGDMALRLGYSSEHFAAILKEVAKDRYGIEGGFILEDDAPSSSSSDTGELPPTRG